MLTNDLQVVRPITLGPATEWVILARITSRHYCRLGVTERVEDRLPLAPSVGVPNEKGQVRVRCMNPGGQPLKLEPGQNIGRYTAL